MEAVSGEEKEGVSFGKKVFIQAQEGRKKQIVHHAAVSESKRALGDTDCA